jgi:hypothetical protein
LLASRGASEFDGPAVHLDRAGVRAIHAGKRLDERRFAGAIVAEQTEDFSRTDIQRDVLQDVDRAKGLADVSELQDGRRHDRPHFFFGE